jgi:hypothetical protein
MENAIQKLPIGIQSFETLRKNGDIYIDKTQHIYQLVNNHHVAFLSRPRRFGKSLMISTLHELFNGRKDLFEGLYIYDKWDWTKTNPVIRIDWTTIESTSPETIKTELIKSLKRQAKNSQITLISESAMGCFSELIEELHRKFDQKVVILIDEYDKPVTDNLLNPQVKSFIRTVHDFYQVMKGADDHIRMIFLTGVSKFAGLSVFSALNNVTDISLRPEYASICGYSQQELETGFAAHIESVAERMSVSKEKLLKQIKYWYDGYSWDGKTFMYNPFSTLNFLDVAQFVGYWFGTGTPRMLFDIIGKKEKPEMTLKKVSTTLDRLDKGYDPISPNEMTLLFQTGYLTVKNIDESGFYDLDIPNTEVDMAMSQNLLSYYNIYGEQEMDDLRIRIEKNLRAGETEQLANAFKYVFEVPNQIKSGKEASYHSVLLTTFKALGFKLDGEVPTEDGRIDAVWYLRNLTVIVEIKQHKTKSAETLLKEALQQIHTRKYYEKYLGEIVLLAVAFSDNNVECKMERLTR